MPTAPTHKMLGHWGLQSRAVLGSSGPPSCRPSSTDFVRVEKNLASLGFFTPSNKKIKGVRAKTILFNRQIDGQRLEVKAVILPSAAYGLPITSDQDKYLAFQKIISETRRQRGEVKNPVGFRSAEMLRILTLNTDAGKNYQDIVEWGKRMTLTGICSEGVIYLAGRKAWASDTFHVFERFVSVGNQMPDGSIADRNYVWLSEWQLENINHHHLLPVDLETYRQLKNHIAKALVPLLQVWLYATVQVGFFEKRYRDLCQILNIAEYKHVSKIREKLGPSLDELQKHRYLSGWRIQPTTNDDEFKVMFHHGQKFQPEPIPQKEQPSLQLKTDNAAISPSPSQGKVDRELLFQLMKRGITEKASIELLRTLQPDQQVMDQLEWGDHLVIHSSKKHKFYNPAGLYIHLIKENAVPPETFATSRRRKLREEAGQAWEREQQQLAALELDYMEYKSQELDQYINTRYTPEEFAALVEAKKKEMLQQTYWKRIFAVKQDGLAKAADRQTRIAMVGQVKFRTIEEFRETRLRAQKQQIQPNTNPVESQELPPNPTSSRLNIGVSDNPKA